MKNLYLQSGVHPGYYHIERFERSIGKDHDYRFNEILKTKELAYIEFCYKWIKLKRKLIE